MTVPKSMYPDFYEAHTVEELKEVLGEESFAELLAVAKADCEETLSHPAEYRLDVNNPDDGDREQIEETLEALKEWGTIGWILAANGFFLVASNDLGQEVRGYMSSGIGGFGSAWVKDPGGKWEETG